MKFNITYDSSVNAANLGSAENVTGFKTQFGAVASLYEGAFVDPITINVTVKVANIAALGESNTPIISSYTYGGDPGIKKAIKDDQTSLDDKSAIAGLPETDAHSFVVTRAQAKALHLLDGGSATSDGTITFSSTAGIFDYSHSTAMSATSYDFYGVAAHELSETMGRILNDGVKLPLELFKTGRPFDGGTAGSFTIDGTTGLLAFNTNSGGDFGDWANSVPGDAFRAFGEPGQVATVSATDLRVLDVIGYDKKATDIAFVIDTTGSMGPYINNVKANAVDVINAAFGTAEDPIDARIGIVGFKDAFGPNGPGEITKFLNFTEHDTYAARKTAAINAINSITVFGGGDTPEADNSGLLAALKGELGEWRKSAQSHKLILFSDAPVKDTGLSGQVTLLAKDLNATITSGSTVASSDGALVSEFTLTSLAIPDPGIGDEAEIGPSSPPGPLPPIVNFRTQVYVIQVGGDASATASLTNIATSTDGTFYTASSFNLADIIKTIIELPPPPIPEPPPPPPPAPGESDPGFDPDEAFGGGTPGPDTLAGTPGNDSIGASSGADSLDGDGGADSIRGGSGGDFVRGDDGADTVDGGPGGDTVNGNTGADSVTGGDGADVVYGGKGDDTIDGGEGDDRHVNGNLGDDIVHGGAGNDTVFGGQGSDQVYGDSGDDRISGDLGNDLLFGGAGADSFVFKGASGQDWIGGFNPGEGDRIVLASGTTYTLATYMGQVVLDLGGGNYVGLAGVDSFNSGWVVFE